MQLVAAAVNKERQSSPVSNHYSGRGYSLRLDEYDTNIFAIIYLLHFFTFMQKRCNAVKHLSSISHYKTLLTNLQFEEILQAETFRGAALKLNQSYSRPDLAHLFQLQARRKIDLELQSWPFC